MRKGIICVILGLIIAAAFSVPMIGAVIFVYGLMLIEDSLTSEDRQIIRSVIRLIKASWKVVYFTVKEKIFRIKPKNN